jgi:hypothetical protein
MNKRRKFGEISDGTKEDGPAKNHVNMFGGTNHDHQALTSMTPTVMPTTAFWLSLSLDDMTIELVKVPTA